MLRAQGNRALIKYRRSISWKKVKTVRFQAVTVFKVL